MNHSRLSTALITEVYFDDPEGERLAARLVEARSAGAELAVLPELPMDPWIPSTRDPDPDDAEEPGGRRHRIQADAARRAGIALLGGAIVLDPESGKRHNTALLFDNTGALRSTYRKVHLPYEEHFWEAAHYEPGGDPPEGITSLSLPMGIQICSDANRSSGCQLLAAQGAAVIVVPRATPAASWDRWRMVLRADAVTSAAWLVTVNRPPAGEPLPPDGPSAVIAPDGRVVAETTDHMAVVQLDGAAVVRARSDYPGYLDFQPEVHRKGWATVSSRSPDSTTGSKEKN